MYIPLKMSLHTDTHGALNVGKKNRNISIKIHFELDTMVYEVVYSESKLVARSSSYTDYLVVFPDNVSICAALLQRDLNGVKHILG